MFPSTLRRDICDSPFNYLEQRLLDPLTRHIPCNRRAVGFPGYLVYLIYINNPFLALIYIIIGILQKTQYDILNILSNIACLSQCCGVSYCKRHIQYLCEGLGEECLAGTCWAKEEYIAFLKFNPAHIELLLFALNPLIVVMDCNGKNLFCLFLPYNIFIKDLLYLRRLRDRKSSGMWHLFFFILLSNYIIAEFHTRITYINHGTSNELSYLRLALTAE